MKLSFPLSSKSQSYIRYGHSNIDRLQPGQTENGRGPAHRTNLSYNLTIGYFIDTPTTRSLWVFASDQVEEEASCRPPQFDSLS